MFSHSLDVLELGKIIDKVKKYAVTNPGQEVISRLSPVNDLEYIKERLAEVTAGKELLKEFGSPPIGRVRDLREVIKKINKGMVLTQKEIVDVRNSLVGFDNLKTYFRKIIEDLDPELVKRRYSLITDTGMEIKVLKSLQRKIDKCINEYGEVKDSASSKLRSLRRQMESIEGKVKDKLESIIRGTKYQSMLQDSLVTKRDNRYVVPIKHEYRNTFSGIVHDQSASGMTIFMEPMAIVKLNNRLREIKAEEEAEIYRILQELTAEISENLDKIKANFKLAIVLDVIFARSDYSKEIDGMAPQVNNQGMINIVQGRHPLLQNDPVPIDINVGDQFKTLVITGPNTGGKTVALKTLGLFVLMVEIGLHIPVNHGTNISLFKEVFADIGDEQSIEQNLSTFSSHVNNIEMFLEEAADDSLVLMDELGAGTDPREGAALGIAILERFKAKGVITVATTHYSELKSYAYSSSEVENASVEFDIETLQPTYRLIMGVPGGSNAFQIALKLGIPESIIEESKKLVDSQDLKVEDIISDLNKERKRYKELRREVERKDVELTRLKKDYETKLDDLDEEKINIIKEARQEAKEIIRKAKKESKNIIRDLKEADYTNRSAVDRKANQINKEIKNIEGDFSAQNTDSNIQNQNDLDDIKVGDQVRVKSVGQKGKVLSIDENKGEATIQAGIMKVTADLNELVKVDMPEVQKQEMIKKYKVKKAEKVSNTIDLRGERYEDAQRRLDKYLDDALLAGYKEVEIIHGKGTGALREAVTEVLERNSHIPSFRLGRQEEGGTGVTIATISR